MCFALCLLLFFLLLFFLFFSRTTRLTISTYQVSVKLIFLHFALVSVYFALGYGSLMRCAPILIRQLLYLGFVACFFRVFMRQPMWYHFVGQLKSPVE